MQPWKYVGVVCFPNLDNRQALKKAIAVNDEDELKVLLKILIFSLVKLCILSVAESFDKRGVRWPGLVESKCCIESEEPSG